MRRMTSVIFADIIFAIERTHHALIYYSPQRAKVRHEYFELSDRINGGPLTRRLSQTRIIEMSVSTIVRLSPGGFFVSDLIPAEFPTRPRAMTLCMTTLRYIAKRVQNLYAESPHRDAWRALLLAVSQISELVTIVIANDSREIVCFFFFLFTPTVVDVQTSVKPNKLLFNHKSLV